MFLFVLCFMKSQLSDTLICSSRSAMSPSVWVCNREVWFQALGFSGSWDHSLTLPLASWNRTPGPVDDPHPHPLHTHTRKHTNTRLSTHSHTHSERKGRAWQRNPSVLERDPIKSAWVCLSRNQDTRSAAQPIALYVCVRVLFIHAQSY